MMTRSDTPSRPAAPDEPELPPQPPPPLREPYLNLSWAYIYWCLGMLVWTILCVVYFILTWQWTNMYIGICLGVLLVAMIALPALLFGGKTWYKRLAWMTILLCLSSAMSVYPMVVVIVGIYRRLALGTYHHWLTFNETLHVALCVLTVGVTIWTDLVTIRAGRLVRRLYRGDYEQ